MDARRPGGVGQPLPGARRHLVRRRARNPADVAHHRQRQSRRALRRRTQKLDRRLMLLGYNSWSMPTLDIDTTVRHLAKLGYDSMELTICPGWPTEALGLDAMER